jgi:hypothetical protein
MEIGDLLDETFRMYRRHFLLFAGISVLLSVPTAALYGIGFGMMGTVLQQAGNGQPADFSAFGAIVPVLVGASLVGIALIPFTFGAIIFAACESALGRPVTAGSVFRGVLRRYFPLLGYWLLFNPVTASLALILCIAPFVLWIWLFVLWVGVTPAMFIEDIGLGAAIGRSRSLVHGRWWRTFLVLFLLGIIFYVVRLGLGAFIQLGQVLLQVVLSPFIALAITSASAQVIDALVNPLLQIAIVLIYFDLRVRREALDLFQMAQQVVAPPAAP